MEKPKLYMMIGLPAAGKSTWIEKFIKTNGNTNLLIASSDHYIEAVAEAAGLTYNQAFQGAVKDAMRYVDKIVELALQNQSDLIWDQTNLTAKAREPRIAKFKDYYKIAIYVHCNDALEHHRRLNSRPGKNIPTNVLNTMMAQFQPPTLAEGFDDIIEVNT